MYWRLRSVSSCWSSMVSTRVAASPTREGRFTQLLPPTLSYGVFFLCTSRPLHIELAQLESKAVESIDLDDSDWAASNESLCRQFWEHAAPDFPIPVRDKALELGAGNILYAVSLAALKPSEWRAGVLPRGLLEFTNLAWARINAIEPAAVRDHTRAGLGLLTAAREALSLAVLAELVGWPLDGGREAFLGAARPYLLEEEIGHGETGYRLCHRSFRDFLGKALEDALPVHHRTLANRLGWPASDRSFHHRYALRHTVLHHMKGGNRAAAVGLCTNMQFLQARLEAGGIAEVAADLDLLAIGEGATSFLAGLARAVHAEFDALRAYPATVAIVVYNRLILQGWKDAEIRALNVIDVSSLPLRLLHPLQNTASLRGHGEAIRATTSTTDGRLALSASDDRTIRVWDLASGDVERVIGRLQGNAREISDCVTTPDGRLLGASADGVLRSWDISSGEEVWRIRAHELGVNACALTPDGTYLVTASSDSSLKLWTVSEGREVRTFIGHEDVVQACAITPDGRRLVSGAVDGALYVWDLASGGLLRRLDGHQERVTDCVVTCDGAHVVSASADRTLRIWSLASGELIQVLEGHTETVLSCAVGPDGRIVSAAEDRTLRVWDWRRATTALTVIQGPNRFTCVHFRGAHVIAGDAAGNVWMLGAQLPEGPRNASDPENRTSPLPTIPRPKKIVKKLSKPPPVEPEVLTVLLVSASPETAERLRVDQQFHDIIERMRGVRHRDRFKFEIVQAARFADLVTALQEHMPHVLHISANGGPDGSLLFQGKRAESEPISPMRLIKLLTALSDNLRMVVINADHSLELARAIPPTIAIAIGMRGKIQGAAAIDFADNFYATLGYGKPVLTAFNVAVASIADSEVEVPQLFHSEVKDAHEPHKLSLFRRDGPNTPRGP